MNIVDHPVNRVEDFLPWNCAAKLVLYDPVGADEFLNHSTYFH